MTPGFHAKDGLTFLRLDDGSVEITIRQNVWTVDWEMDGPYKRRVIGETVSFRTVLEPGSWASVLCSMSAMGEDGRTIQIADDFHAGRLERTEP